MTDPSIPTSERPDFGAIDAEERNYRRALLARRVFIAAGLVAGVMAMIMLVVVVALIRGDQTDNSDVLDAVEGCTTPGRDCYERSQKATARAVADISRSSIYAAACAVVIARQGLPEQKTAAETERCVIELFEILRDADRPSP